MKVMLPNKLSDPDGPHTVALEDHYFLCAQKGDEYIIEIEYKTAYTSWCRKGDLLLCKTDKSKFLMKAVRVATHDDIRRLRLPRWAQGEETPMCCERPMMFVAQHDDPNLADECPEGATAWFHDAVSFYIFICPKCLETCTIHQTT